MTIEEAKVILESHGYEVLPMPTACSALGPGLFMSVEPHSHYFDVMRESDALQLAEALQDNHRCYVCQEPAVSRCPTCNRWTCEDCRRDFPPRFDDHICGACIIASNVAVWEALAYKEEHRESA